VTTAPEAQNVTGYAGGIRRIMVVDDRPENRAVLKGMLEPLGFEILEAANGRECLDQLIPFHPDAILMDLRMPVMGGLEAMRSLRQMSESRDCTVIAISASAFEHDEQESRSAGANDFLAKPFRLQRLLDLLGQHLKLDWIVERPDEVAVEAAPVAIVPPPDESLTRLFDLARQGDIQELLSQSDRLTHSGYAGFATVVRSLAQEFKLREIREFITQHRSPTDDPS
jgi:CheY-like chemotaxis protein